MNPDDTTNTTVDHDKGAADLQQWIDSLLRSSEAAELEAAPESAHVAATAIAQIRRRQTRRRSLAAFAAAAAMVGAIAMWSSTPLPRREGTGEGLSAPLVIHAPEAPATVKNPSLSLSLQGRGIEESVARFVSSGETIAVPLASDDPQVSIVKLYPTTTTERRWRRELVTRDILTEPNGG